MGARRRFRRPEPVSRRCAPGAHVRARDAPVPVGRAAHGPRPQLHARRRRRAHPPEARLHRAQADRLRRVRASGRERSHPRGQAPARRDEPEHRRDPRADEAPRVVDRLEPRALDRRARLLPLDTVALPQVLRGGARVPQGRDRQLVPERPDGARERAGDRRTLRALRLGGRGAHAGAVVLPDHRLRRPASRRHGDARVLARARAHDAAQLDRALGRGGGHLSDRGARHRHPRLHDAPRHALRRHVLRPLARACARRATGERDSARAGGHGLRAPCGRPPGCRARRPREGEDRGLHRAVRHEPGQRQPASDLGLRLRAHGVRHRRDHGRARPRRARLRVRKALRAAHQDSHRPG